MKRVFSFSLTIIVWFYKCLLTTVLTRVLRLFRQDIHIYDFSWRYILICMKFWRQKVLEVGLLGDTVRILIKRKSSTESTADFLIDVDEKVIVCHLVDTRQKRVRRDCMKLQTVDIYRHLRCHQTVLTACLKLQLLKLVLLPNHSKINWSNW